MDRIRPTPSFLLVAAAILLGAGPAVGQDMDALRAQYVIRLPSNMVTRVDGSRPIPSSTTAIPFGFGADWGDGFVGGVAVNEPRELEADRGLRRNADGAAAAGFGFGNATHKFGVEVVVMSYSTFRSGFGDRGGVDLKLHRVFSQNWSIAVGATNVASWGVVDQEPSFYAVGSRVLNHIDWAPFQSVTMTVGAGNGDFRKVEDLRADKETVGVFGALAVQAIEQASVIAEWTGQDLNLGLSILPIRKIPLTINPTLLDLSKTAGDHVRFGLSAGLGFNFKSLFSRQD